MTYELPYPPSDDLICSPNHCNTAYSVGYAAGLAEGRREVSADAARYQWLRDKSQPGICSFYLSVGQAFHKIKFAVKTVDAAIDAAMLAAAPEPGHDQP